MLTPVISWTVDGVMVGSAPTLSSDLFTRDQEVAVAVAMHDGNVEGIARFAGPVVVRNAVPSVLAVDLDPAAPDTDDDVTCIPRGWSDADSDTEDYIFQWTLDGAPGPSTHHWDLSGATAAAGQTLTCTVVPDDGRTAGVPVSNSVVLSGA